MDPPAVNPLAQALHCLFNDDLLRGALLLAGYRESAPDDPLGHAISATFEFYASLGKAQQAPRSPSDWIFGSPPAIGSDDMRSVDGRCVGAERCAAGEDANAIPAMMLVEGIRRDASATLERKWTASLRHAEKSYKFARRLLKLNARDADAFVTVGFTHYLISFIPPFARWVADFPGLKPDRKAAARILEAAARSATYLQPFALQMLAELYRHEKIPDDRARILLAMAERYPGNPAYRVTIDRELAKIRL